MTKLLVEAFEALERLPETEQNRAARIIIEFASFEGFSRDDQP